MKLGVLFKFSLAFLFSAVISFGAVDVIDPAHWNAFLIEKLASSNIRAKVRAFKYSNHHITFHIDVESPERGIPSTAIRYEFGTKKGVLWSEQNLKVELIQAPHSDVTYPASLPKLLEVLGELELLVTDRRDALPASLFAGESTKVTAYPEGDNYTVEATSHVTRRIAADSQYYLGSMDLIYHVDGWGLLTASLVQMLAMHADLQVPAVSSEPRRKPCMHEIMSTHR